MNRMPKLVLARVERDAMPAPPITARDLKGVLTRQPKLNPWPPIDLHFPAFDISPFSSSFFFSSIQPFIHPLSPSSSSPLRIR